MLWLQNKSGLIHTSFAPHKGASSVNDCFLSPLLCQPDSSVPNSRDIREFIIKGLIENLVLRIYLWCRFTFRDLSYPELPDLLFLNGLKGFKRLS